MSTRVVIIGNGVAGITAARTIRKRKDWDITVISAESEHFYSRPALMYIFMGSLRYEHTKPYEDYFWKKNRIGLVRGTVERIDLDAGAVILQDGRHVPYDKLLIATGSVNRKSGLPGEDLRGVVGFNSLQDIGLLEQEISGVDRAVVVAGGLTGIELVEMIRSRGIPVTCLVRGSSYFHRVLPSEESAMINRHIRKAGIDLRLSAQLKEIVDDGSGRVGAVVTDTGERIDCRLLGVAVGVQPNSGMVKESGIAVARGIITDGFLRTGYDNIYAAGDCAEIPLPDGTTAVEQLWYAARKQGETAGLNICGEKTAYQQGIFYNSAKFLDIEYQVYGRVNRKVPGEQSLYWEHPDGEKSIRIVYTDKQVIGFNLMGIRYRHRVCEGWLREKRSLEYVLAHLHEANFDTEFYKRYEAFLKRGVTG